MITLAVVALVIAVLARHASFPTRRQNAPR